MIVLAYRPSEMYARSPNQTLLSLLRKKKKEKTKEMGNRRIFQHLYLDKKEPGNSLQELGPLKPRSTPLYRLSSLTITTLSLSTGLVIGGGGGGGAINAGLGLLRSYHSLSTTRSRSSSHDRSESMARDGTLGGGSGTGIFCSHSIWRMRSRRRVRSSSVFWTRRRTSSCGERVSIQVGWCSTV